MIKNIAAVLLIALVLSYAAIEVAQGFGAITPLGVEFDLRSGSVTAVDAASPAAVAGVRRGDRADFSRGGWPLHLSLDRTALYSGQHVPLPLIRNGKAITVTLVGPPAAPPNGAWAYFVGAIVALVYAGLGAALYLLRRNSASLAFLAFTCGQAAAFSNTDVLLVASPAWMPLAMLVAGLSAALTSYGLLYFAVIFANQSRRATEVRRFVILPGVLFMLALYELHFYTYTIWSEPFNVYAVSTILNWLVFAIAGAAIISRINRDAATAVRLRWVAVAIWLQALLFAAFFVDQNVSKVASGGTAAIVYLNSWFQPGTLCIAYVLLRTRVIDARIIGARTLVYGLLTAIPIGLFSIVDWFFARRLADARLATFAEFGIAVLFGVWLNSLHRRIDRFVERIVFASRHQAFQRLRHAIHALSGAERSETPIAMLCSEAAGALRLASAAVFLERGGVYERIADCAWDGCARELQPDDPLVLFARSEQRTVRLSDVAPSPNALPHGDGKPEVAIPIHVRHQTIGVAVYGGHETGEHLDADEEELLAELAHAAGAALGRLQSVERVRELEAELKIATV